MTDIVPIHCPHCGFGNSMVEAYEDDYGYWKVGCGACGSHSGTLHPNHKPDAKRLVIESWNRRTEEDLLRQLLSEAEKREKEARAKALEEAAAVVDLVAEKTPWLQRRNMAIRIARSIRALQSEERT